MRELREDLRLVEKHFLVLGVLHEVALDDFERDDLLILGRLFAGRRDVFPEIHRRHPAAANLGAERERS